MLRPPPPALPRLAGPRSPIKMRICFLPKRRENREEMVRPMAVVAQAIGRSSKEACGASPGLLVPRFVQTERDDAGDRPGQNGRGRHGSQVDASVAAPRHEVTE